MQWRGRVRGKIKGTEIRNMEISVAVTIDSLGSYKWQRYKRLRKRRKRGTNIITHIKGVKLLDGRVRVNIKSNRIRDIEKRVYNYISNSMNDRDKDTKVWENVKREGIIWFEIWFFLLSRKLPLATHSTKPSRQE